MPYVLDEKGQSVVRALENPKWDWRTIDGIAEETGIDPHQVASILTFSPEAGDHGKRVWSDAYSNRPVGQILPERRAGPEATKTL